MCKLIFVVFSVGLVNCLPVGPRGAGETDLEELLRTVLRRLEDPYARLFDEDERNDRMQADMPADEAKFVDNLALTIFNKTHNFTTVLPNFPPLNFTKSNGTSVAQRNREM